MKNWLIFAIFYFLLNEKLADFRHFLLFLNEKLADFRQIQSVGRAGCRSKGTWGGVR